MDGSLEKPWSEITGRECDDYRKRRVGSLHTSFISQGEVLRKRHIAKNVDWGFVETINKMGGWFLDCGVVYRGSREIRIETDCVKLMQSKEKQEELITKIIQLKIAEG